MNKENIKEFEVYKNGTHHATVKANNLNEAKKEVFDWYGKELEVYPKEPELIEDTKYARVCSVTGEGMNEGFCFGDGEDYAKTEESALILAKERGYKTLKQAYNDEVYYYTEWEEEDYQYIVKDGELVEIN
jgi:hypothetical protein